MKETRVLVCILLLCTLCFIFIFIFFFRLFYFTDWVYIFNSFGLMLLVEQIVIVLRETAQLHFIPFNENKKKIIFFLFCLCFLCLLLEQSLCIVKILFCLNKNNLQTPNYSVCKLPLSCLQAFLIIVTSN